jgi:hypothetical protein
VFSCLLRYEIEIIPPDTQKAENSAIYKPRLLLKFCGSDVRITPINPITSKKKTKYEIFSLKIKKAKIEEKKTLVKLTVLA